MQADSFFIGGEWVAPLGEGRVELRNPADGALVGTAALGDARDADRAVQAAAAAFLAWSASSVAQRLELLARMRAGFAAIADDLAAHLVREIGLTSALARGQSMLCLAHFDENMAILRDYAFTTRPDPMVEIIREPVGVVAALTSWNAPVSQMLCKAVPAIAAGCTVVVKPSERAPLCGALLAEAMARAAISARCVQPAQRRSRLRAGAGGTSLGRHDQLHRLGRGRRGSGGQRCAHDQAGASGTGRQERQYPAG